MKKSVNIYLDYAAATPLDPAVAKRMQPFLSEIFANPSSAHTAGEQARYFLEASRKTIAQTLNCKPDEIIFTAGGTESLNLAILGRYYWAKQNGNQKPHFITTAIEHSAVHHILEAIVKMGGEATILPVNEEGQMNTDDLQKAVRPATTLISIIYANNEIGTIQPLATIGRTIGKINSYRSKNHLPPIIFHSDASQAGGLLDIVCSNLGVDLLTLNAGKIYGPKQVGCLYKKSGTNILPIFYGGGQEYNFRSGTENVPGIIGFAEALKLAKIIQKKEQVRLKKLTQFCLSSITKIYPVKLNGPKLTNRLPGNLNLFFPNIEGESLMFYLNSKKVFVSTGSACDSKKPELSKTLKAIGLNPQVIKSSIRITLGKYTTKEEINKFIKILQAQLQILKQIKN